MHKITILKRIPTKGLKRAGEIKLNLEGVIIEPSSWYPGETMHTISVLSVVRV